MTGMLPVSGSIVAANRAVVKQLAVATSSGRSALSAVTHGAGVAELRTHISTAVEALSHAQRAAGALRSNGTNILDPAAHRYLSHAVSDANHAASTLSAPGRVTGDARAMLADRLFSLEVNARVGHQYASRSLHDARIQVVAPPRTTHTAGNTSSGGRLYLGESNQWVDELGNPTRGGSNWTGPDGQQFTTMGEAVTQRANNSVDKFTGESFDVRGVM